MSETDKAFAAFEGHMKKAAKDLFLIVQARYDLERRSREFEAGPRSASLEPSNGGGGHSDPTGDAAMNPDEGAFRWDDLNGEARRIAERLKRLRTLVEMRVSSPGDVAQRAVAKSGRISCANPNCGKVVAGTPEDRLRGERCVPCYQYFWRTGNDRPWGLIHRDSQVTK